MLADGVYERACNQLSCDPVGSHESRPTARDDLLRPRDGAKPTSVVGHVDRRAAHARQRHQRHRRIAKAGQGHAALEVEHELRRLPRADDLQPDTGSSIAAQHVAVQLGRRQPRRIEADRAIRADQQRAVGRRAPAMSGTSRPLGVMRCKASCDRR